MNITSINVDIDNENGQIVISDTVTLNYGVGETFTAALVDYCQSVLEWNEMQEADAKRDSEELPFTDEPLT